MGCGKSKELRDDNAGHDNGTELNGNASPGKPVKEKKNKKEVRVLLLGPGESGKSTLFKQLQIIQDAGGYTEAQLRGFIPTIRSNIVANMKILVGARSWIKTTKDFSDEGATAVTILENANINDWSDDIGRACATLWDEPTIQEIFSKKDSKENHNTTHFQLSETAPYFFNSIMRIATAEYVPTSDDVLRARTRTTDVQRSTFKFDNIPMVFIDVGGQRCERTKWLPLRDESTAVIYTAAISEYDQYLKEDKQTNRVLEALVLFEDVSNAFADKSVILFMNKIDLFIEKVKRVPLNVCFDDYQGDNSFEDASQFIRGRFMEVAANPKSVYTHFTCAVDSNNIRTIFDDVKRIVLTNTIKDVLPI